MTPEVHQEGVEDRGRHGRLPLQGREAHDPERGLSVNEPHGLRPHRRHVGCTCSKSILANLWVNCPIRFVCD